MAATRLELMKTFSIRTLLVLVAIAALIVWWSVSGFRVIHQETSPGHGEILISIKQEWMSGQYKMRIKYIPTGAQPDEIHLSNTILLGTDQLDQLDFESLIDDETGLWCLYDTARQKRCHPGVPNRRRLSHLAPGCSYWMGARYLD